MWSSTVLIEILKILKEWLTSRKSKRIKETGAVAQLGKVVEIYDYMQRLINSTSVNRFLIHKVHNGGGIIKPLSDLYLTAIYEAYRFPFISIKADFQKLPLDEVSIRILVNAYHSGLSRVVREELEEGFLKNQYTKEGIEISELHFLYQTENFFYFASIATESKDKTLSSAGERSEIQVVMSNIKRLIKP